LAFLVRSPGSSDEQSFVVLDRIFVGRECAGIEPSRRVLIDDAVASRLHFEIRLDTASAQAYLVDSSTNGTRINGARVPRAVPHTIKAGDWVTAGDTEFAFVSSTFTGAGSDDARLTLPRVNLSEMVLVVGDLTNYSAISQVTDSAVVAASLQRLYEELTVLLARHRGTLNHYAGDAICALWELDQIPEADQLGVAFALASHQKVAEVAPGLPLRGPDGDPVRMGWAVVRGPSAITTLTHAVVSVVGDATNLAFRLAGLAGREGRAPVLVSSAVHDLVVDQFAWGEPAHVDTKGRSGQETVYPVSARRPSL
jgi:class 3 adenylate cyclase